MNAKAQFLRDKELVKWWVEIAHSEQFQKVLGYLTVELSVSAPSIEYLKGCHAAINALETLADNPETFKPLPSPGLIHHMPVKP